MRRGERPIAASGLPGMYRPAAFLVVCCALAATPALVEPPRLAPALRVPPDEEPALLLAGAGINLFQCKQRELEPGAYAWFFIAPDATLFDEGRPVATHTAAYRWDALGDRSTVTGVIRAIQSVGPHDLPWALFRATPAEQSGMFAGVTSVLRANTSGGVPDAASCDESHTGEDTRAPFSADYYFYKRRAAR